MSLMWLSDPAVSTKSVRAHIARNTHALVRRERTARYQAQRPVPKALVSEEQVERAAGHHQKLRSCDNPSDTTLDEPERVIYYDRIDHQQQHSQLGYPMSPFESSLFQYYVEAVIPINATPSVSSHSVRAYQSEVLREWLPAALANPGMQMGLYLCACRSLYTRTGAARYLEHAMQYKAACLRLLAASIAPVPVSPSPAAWISDATISMALQLASDDLVSGDVEAWGQHIRAVHEMVRLSGGLDRVQGMKGLLRRLIEVLSSENALSTVLNAVQVTSAAGKLCTLEILFR
ncbi:hypothetical protein F4777DRAFT_382504 [Nemania sp. FL0916]|nr:hypothetical protein F4777DRAFT_382504 [Nemania sp. FL0916]